MPTGPIFVTADEPLLIYESLERAVRDLEWQDVEDGLYRGFDSDGRLVEFKVKPTPRSWKPATWLGDKLVFAEVEPNPTHADELRATLARVTGVPEVVPLDELKHEAVTKFGLS